MAKTMKKIPSGAVLRTDTVLAEGEATGHAHRATGQGVQVYDLPGDVRLIHAPRGATVGHEEHHQIDLTAGQFDVSKVLEYDHFLEEARAVED